MKANRDYKNHPIEIGDVFALSDNMYLIALRHQPGLTDELGTLPERWVTGIGFKANYGFFSEDEFKLARGDVVWLDGPMGETFMVPTDLFFSVKVEVLGTKERIAHSRDGADRICMRIAMLLQCSTPNKERDTWTHDNDYEDEDVFTPCPFAELKDDIEYVLRRVEEGTEHGMPDVGMEKFILQQTY